MVINNDINIKKTILRGYKVENITLFPVINFITGPPGVLRNSGIWKYIKEGIIKTLQIPTIMTQVLHFTDFYVSKSTFEKWWYVDGKKKTLLEWIKEENSNYEPIIFADSGGFKLLYNTQYDLEPFGIDATPDSIFNLQVKLFGARLIASLDYPISPNLNWPETKERMIKSIENAIHTLRLTTTSTEHVLPYLAVHGRNKKEILFYMNHLWNQLQKNNLLEENFGLAIGSLVPIKGNYSAIAEIILSVVGFLRKKEVYESSKVIPLHVFGITGNILPFLALFGINTFDSLSPIQAGINLKFLYYDNISLLSKKVFKLDDWDCEDIICNRLSKEVSYAQFKKYLKAPPYKKLPNLKVKSYYYAQIALHNINTMMNFVRHIRTLLLNNELYDTLKTNLRKNNNRKLFKLIRLYDYFLVHGEVPANYRLDYFIKDSNLESLDIEQLSNHNFVQSPIDSKNKEILLILQCTKTKPYNESSLHRTIFEYLNSNVDKTIVDRIYKVTLSGLFGPVPEEYENDKTVINYDFFLNKYSKSQIRNIKARFIKFLLRHRHDFKVIIAYVATNPYRDVLDSIKNALDLPYFFILPKKMKRSVASELKRGIYLSELKETLLESNKYLSQLSLIDVF